MHTLIYIRDTVGAVPYWACDEKLMDAVERFKRLTGKIPSAKASIVAFSGSLEDLDKIQVNDLGDIGYPEGLTRTFLQ